MSATLSKRARWVGALMSLGALFLAACGSSGPSSTNGNQQPSALVSSGSLKVSGSVSTTLMQAWITAFEKTNPGQEISFTQVSDTRVSRDLDSTDVVVSLSAPLMNQDADQLKTLPESVLGNSRWVGPDKKWIGVGFNPYLLLYNPSVVTNPPRDLESLPKPGWVSGLGFNASTDSFQALVSGLLQSWGQEFTLEWLKAMKAVQKEGDRDDENLSRAVNRNWTDASFVAGDQYEYWSAGHPGATPKPVFFSPSTSGLALNLVVAGVSPKTRNPALANEFLRFITSKSAQRLIPEVQELMYPIDGSIAPNSRLPRLGELGLIRFDYPQESLASARNILREAGLL